MKRTLILAALAALTFASCQKNEVAVETGAESNAITFDVYSARNITKAESKPTNVMTLDTLKKNGLGVFAFYTATSTYDSTIHQTPNFMNNQLVKWESTKWVYTPIKYWPNNTDDKISFFAYAPYSDTVKWNASKPYIPFEVNADVKGQTDLLFSPALKNMTKQKGRDSLKFEFKHALSKLYFQVAYSRDSITYGKGGAIENTTTVVIDSLALKPKTSGFYKSGNLDMCKSNADSAWIPDSKYHTYFKLTHDVNFYADSTATEDRAAGQIVTNEYKQLNAEDSYMMIIPQDFSTSTSTFKDGFDVTVKYHVWTKDTTLADNHSKITNVITTNAKVKFESGKQYLFKLLLGMQSVKISAQVSDWENGDTTLVNLPINQ